MEPEDLLRTVVEVCEKIGIPYFVTGSTATIAYGEPRFTNDIDIVISLTSEQAEAFCKEFNGDDFYLSQSAVLSAVKHRKQFNLIHPASGLKADFMVAPESSFNRSRMSRVRELPILENKSVRFASPEDAILMKLKYFQEGQSDKHIRDIRSVLKIQGDRIDYAYLDDWVSQLSVTTEWKLATEGMKK